MRNAAISFRPPPDIAAALGKAENASAVVVAALRKHLSLEPAEDPEEPDEAAPEAPAAIPAEPDDDGDDGATLRAEVALLRALASVATPGHADALMPSLLALVESGPDGSPQIGGAPITASTVRELIPATMVATNGKGGGGGHAAPEHRTPPKSEPDPSRGLFALTGPADGGTVNVKVDDYNKLDAAAQRRLQMELIPGSR